MWRIKRHALALFITVLSFVLVPAAGHCQERVTNVRAEQQGNQVFIYYDLTGHEGKYQVKVRGSSNGGKDFDLPMKSVSGDIGKGIRPGRGKTIIWDATRDIRQLYGDNFVFEVEATGAEKKRFTNSVGMKFVYIKPGTFMMGSPSSEKGRDSDETCRQPKSPRASGRPLWGITRPVSKEMIGRLKRCRGTTARSL